MTAHRIFGMPFAAAYPTYVKKVARKRRTKEAVDQVIRWLAGYDRASLEHQIEGKYDFQTFFAQAPRIHSNYALITGVVCAVRVDEVENPLMKKIRQLDTLIDERAKGTAVDKVLRK